MSRRPSLSELAWPMDEESHRVAQEWARGATSQILDWTWRGFDALHANLLSRINLQQPLEQLERDLTSKHFIEINLLWAQETGGYPTIVPHPEYPENETRPPAPGKPPAYDFAFVWRDNERVTWPIEAKVIPTERTLADYLADTVKFTSGTAAPLTGEGAQIAYLLTGTAAGFFANLAAHHPLKAAPNLSSRPHRVSGHPRNPAPDLRLHHLVMFCGS